MVKLVAKAPIAEGLPLSIGAVTLSAQGDQVITSIGLSTLPRKTIAAAVKAATKLALPELGRMTLAGDWRALAVLHDHVLVIGPASLPGLDAPISDQSDGWAGFSLCGPDAEAVLARLVPLDLREAVFDRRACAKTILGHLPVLICRNPTGFDLWCFRSMAQSALHDMSTAMRLVAARKG